LAKKTIISGYLRTFLNRSPLPAYSVAPPSSHHPGLPALKPIFKKFDSDGLNRTGYRFTFDFPVKAFQSCHKDLRPKVQLARISVAWILSLSLRLG
jgi:hypothetical protein